MTPAPRLAGRADATGQVSFPALGTVSFPALGTTAVLLTTDASRTDVALQVLRAELAAIDAACSRFRSDSELSLANATAGTGRPVPVGALLAEAIEVALRAARLTGGAVDPTVGRASAALGYDVTFTRIARTGPAPELRLATGWRSVGWDAELRLLRLPAGTALDLGATAKALAADRAARAAAAAAGCGVLVGLGGDLSTAGPAPDGGWRIAVADDHAGPAEAGAPVVTVRSGGLATSGTTVRAWERGGRRRHHIIDPATGDSAPEIWRTASVAAAGCVDANTASTAAIVLGERAADWLRDTGLPARLVRADGAVVRLNGWPPDGPRPREGEQR
jgi:thiamine biosynthesis lipoprotein